MYYINNNYSKTVGLKQLGDIPCNYCQNKAEILQLGTRIHSVHIREETGDHHNLHIDQSLLLLHVHVLTFVHIKLIP